jgi:hypothetical protein
MKAIRLFAVLFQLTLCLGTASASTLINGANQTGIIFSNTVADTYTFTANAGDSINLRLGTTNFYGYLQLFGPDATLQDAVGGYPVKDDAINYTATNSGTFTVLVSSAVTNGSGTYELHLAQVPEAFIVPAGDQGGPMTNGGNYDGTITLGDLDMYTFTANAGDNINLRLGTTNFIGHLELYGPNGALLSMVGAYPNKDDLITYTATNSGTFTVLVCDGYGGETGTYELHLAQAPEPFIVPAGDQGGAMTNGGSYTGAITLGDLDMYSCQACKGDVINLELKSTNFIGKLQLYGPNGALLDAVGGYPITDDVLTYTATNCGTFTVVVSDGYSEEAGTYGLTANGIFDGLSLSPPVISGTNIVVSGAGGTTNTSAVLYSSTNFTLWAPVLTNHFDLSRKFHYTNLYQPGSPMEFFKFIVP